MAGSKKKNQLKNIEIWETEAGQSYRVRIHWKGKSYRATRDSLVEAISWRDQTTALLKSGQPLPGEVPAGDITIGEASDKFLATAVSRSAATINMYRWAQQQLLAWFTPQALLSAITTERVHAYMVHRMSVDGVSGSKVCQELSFLRLIYETAPIWGINIQSPERSIKRPRKNTSSREEKRSRVIQPDEIRAILAAAGTIDHHLQLFLAFLLLTGMRPSEAASLRWQRLPPREEKLAAKDRQHIGYIDIGRGGCAMVGTKTETRFVPLHPLAIRLIEQLREIRHHGSPLLFLPEDHGQKNVPYQFFRWKFRRAAKLARLSDGSSLRENIDFYSFRHTARTRMATCGVQDSAAETIIGHADKEMVRTYTHYGDADLIAEMQKVRWPEIMIPASGK